jgi:hypothetical protein
MVPSDHVVMVSHFLFGVLMLFVVLFLERAPPNQGRRDAASARFVGHGALTGQRVRSLDRPVDVVGDMLEESRAIAVLKSFEDFANAFVCNLPSV